MNAPPPRQPDVARPVTESTRDRVTGVDIRVDRVGAGDPLVILNGLLGLNEHWFPCLGPIAAEREIVLLQPPLLEMRGKGLSVEGVQSLIESVLESLLDRPAVVMGNSFGGHIALRIARDRPELVEGMVLIGSSGLFERSFERGVQHAPSRSWLEGKIAELFFNRSAMLPSMVDRAHDVLSQRPAARAMVRLGRSAKRDYLGDQLHLITPRTLLVWGRQDIVTPPEVAEEFADKLAHAELHWVERCGHAPHIENPPEVAAAVVAFLGRLRGAGAGASVA